MNSLNIISARVSPPSSPGPSRSNSLGTLGLAVTAEEDSRVGGGGGGGGGGAASSSDDGLEFAENNEKEKSSSALMSAEPDSYRPDTTSDLDDERHHYAIDEDTPLLLGRGETKEISPRVGSSYWHMIPKRIASTLLNSIRWVLSTLAAPGVYLIACLYDEHGAFAPLLQLRKLFGTYNGNTRKMAWDNQEAAMQDEQGRRRPSNSNLDGGGSYDAAAPSRGTGSSSSGLSSESESDLGSSRASSTKHMRSKSLQDTEEIAPARRSIRIKLHSDELLRQRKHRKAQSTSTRSSSSTGGAGGGSPGDISAQLKSPTSPHGALTKYPKTPAPPRPLIPRRQPSYLNVETGTRPQKTLILDLDETLIHSMSKGGRMGTGHMVEVRLNTTYVGVGGQASIGPQHPILYFVHKRPHCDDFLRRVSKWFNLVVFTASVQEYADPVIDWLETDRKFFSGRYYRQHCTFRHGAFIKDLSSVEPDLSKVMILDNSPLSYMFHQDNAIPIQGWINDPTDNDLLHLVPFLEGLQYVSDVRALLALRGGEDGKHMA